MKMRAVLLAAAQRLEAGENFYDAVAICDVVGWAWHNPMHGVAMCPVVNTYLQLSGYRGAVDAVAALEQHEAAVAQAVAQAVGANATPAQSLAAGRRVRIAMLSHVADMVSAEAEIP